MDRRRIPLDTYSGRTARRMLRRRQERGAMTIVAAVCVGMLVTMSGLAWAWDRFDMSEHGLVQALADRPSRQTEDRDAAKPAARRSTEATARASAATSVAEPGGGERSPAAEATDSAPATITVAAVGDLLFDRKVGAFIRQQGGEAPLEAVADRLAGADITFGNLETVLGTTGKPVANKQYTFRGESAAISGLKLAGFDALSLANNHTLDYGPEPLSETITLLKDAGIDWAGAGPNLDAAWKPAVVGKRGAKTAILAFTHIIPPGFIAENDKAGVASGRMDAARTVAAIRRAKRHYDYVIVSYHWGIELQDNANGDQAKWARRAIDAGADMVIGHHPHVIQGVEFYKGRLIAYSLGDFVWDHNAPKSGESFILEAEMGPHGVANVSAVPVYMDRLTGKPSEVDGERAATILGRLATISKRHGTDVEVGPDKALLLP